MTDARRSDLSKLGVLITVVVLCIAAWVSPYWSVAGLARSAALGNTYELSEYIDMPSLRESIKGQITAQLTKEISTRNSSGFEVLGNALGLMMVDKAVDQFVTTSTLSNLLKQFIGARAKDVPSRTALTMRLVEASDVEWASSDIAYFGLGGEGRLVLRRSMLSWKLVGIELPAEAFEP